MWVVACVFGGKRYQISDFDPFHRREKPKATVEDLRRIFVR